MKYLAAVLAAKDERPIISEWMAFHRAAGVEHLIIIDNGSSDGMADSIKAFPDPASVTLLRRPERRTQMDLYDEVVRTFGIDYEWMAFIDADEFLYPVDGGDLRETLTEFERAAAVGAHWMIYGSSGHIQPPNGLVIENYKYRGLDNFIMNRHIKSIVRPRYQPRALGPHAFQINGIYLNDSGDVLPIEPPCGFFEKRTATHVKMRINHYHVRSRVEYEVKKARGYFGLDDTKLSSSSEQFEAMFAVHDQNEIEDASACVYIERMAPFLP